jgi:uncharacterized membrane protein YtjA (UPF0391 family)
MLKRAYISAIIAAIAAILGFSGLLDGAAPIVKGISYVAAGFCGLSLIFSLFEDAKKPEEPTPEKPSPQLVFNFAADQADGKTIPA